jgi:hypothetical protein
MGLPCIKGTRSHWHGLTPHPYLEDFACGDCIFAATGVTQGSLLDGVKRRRHGVVATGSVVMRAATGTVRWVTDEYRRVPAESGSLRWSGRREFCTKTWAERPSWVESGRSMPQAHQIAPAVV